MMIHNLVKYFVQTRISQTKSSLDKIFYIIMYHHIIYMCDFFGKFRQFFAMVCTGFHKFVVCTRYVSNFFCPIVHFTYLVRPIILKKIIFPIKFKLDNLHAYPDFRKITIFGKFNMNAYSRLTIQLKRSSSRSL